ncbi:hypothetical protein [Nocardia sp. NPDC003963]
MSFNSTELETLNRPGTRRGYGWSSLVQSRPGRYFPDAAPEMPATPEGEGDRMDERIRRLEHNRSAITEYLGAVSEYGASDG